MMMHVEMLETQVRLVERRHGAKTPIPLARSALGFLEPLAWIVEEQELALGDRNLPSGPLSEASPEGLWRLVG